MRLTFTDGTTSVEFGHLLTSNLLRQYTPQTPEVDEVRSESPVRDGGEIPIAAYRNPTENADVAWTGTLSQQRAAMQALNLLFGQARRYQRTGMGSRVYCEFLATDDEAGDYGEAWRSEVLSGRVLVDDGSFRLGLQLEGDFLLSRIIWTRRYYWEGALVELALSNQHGTGLGGVTVYDHDDAEHDNTLDIDAADVEGDLPAPCELQFENTYDSYTAAYAIYIAHNVDSDPANLAHMLPGGTTAACGLTETWLKTWTLDSALLQACGGNVFHLLAPIDGLYSTAWLKWNLDFGPTTIWSSGWFNLTTFLGGEILADTGSIRLPPRRMVDTGTPYPLELLLWGKDSGGFTAAIDIAFVQLSATDSWRVLQPAGYGIDQGVRLVDDPIEGTLYTEGWSDPGRTYHYTTLGDPIMLRPGRDQRLYILHGENAWNYTEARTLEVRAWYRARRLVL